MCKVEGCDRQSKARGMCLMHYKRDRYGRHGVMGWPRKGDPCEHCEKPSVARGYCSSHYYQWQRYGDPEYFKRRSTTFVSRGYEFERGHGAGGPRPLHRIISGAKPGEVVHHINGVKSDNNITNLAVLASQSVHASVHNSLEQAAFALVRAGVIVFDHAACGYRVSDEHVKMLVGVAVDQLCPDQSALLA